MTDILLTGCNGRMGNAVVKACLEYENCRICGGVDVMVSNTTYDFPVCVSAEDFPGNCNVIVDFSHHTATEGLLNFAISKNLPIVIATTGHTPEETAAIKEAAKKIPVFYSRNMSLGINLIIALAKKAMASLGESYDIEIIEKHHNKKLDAPSGTALMIANAIKTVRESAKYVFGRSGMAKRETEEIGIHAVRRGNIVGIHEVIVSTDYETVTIKHEAHSRSLFAEGAVTAAAFLMGKEPGLYEMSSLIG